MDIDFYLNLLFYINLAITFSFFFLINNLKINNNILKIILIFLFYINVISYTIIDCKFTYLLIQKYYYFVYSSTIFTDFLYITIFLSLILKYKKVFCDNNLTFILYILLYFYIFIEEK